ncbi:MAG: hypothetical protein HQM01_13715 [Magnetococcales bacterium]|nr:hypothetical protein [Magnetococcales bacterium]
MPRWWQSNNSTHPPACVTFLRHDPYNPSNLPSARPLLRAMRRIFNPETVPPDPGSCEPP